MAPKEMYPWDYNGVPLPYTHIYLSHPVTGLTPAGRLVSTHRRYFHNSEVNGIYKYVQP